MCGFAARNASFGGYSSIKRICGIVRNKSAFITRELWDQGGISAPTVSGNYADDTYGTVTVEAGDKVTDRGTMVYYTSYGIADSVNFSGYAGGPTVASNSNPEAVSVTTKANSDGSMSVEFTGKSEGTATVKVEYAAVNKGCTRPNLERYTRCCNRLSDLYRQCSPCAYNRLHPVL